jgi:hypothetical protein
MNILIKLTSIVALIIAPHISQNDHGQPETAKLNAPRIESVANRASQ